MTTKEEELIQEERLVEGSEQEESTEEVEQIANIQEDSDNIELPFTVVHTPIEEQADGSLRTSEEEPAEEERPRVHSEDDAITEVAETMHIEPIDRDEQEENKPTEELASTKEAVEEMVATKKTKTQEVQEERKDVKGCEVEGETQAKDRKGQQGNREKRTRGDELKEKLAEDEEMSIQAYRLILGHYWWTQCSKFRATRTVPKWWTIQFSLPQTGELYKIYKERIEGTVDEETAGEAEFITMTDREMKERVIRWTKCGRKEEVDQMFDITSEIWVKALKDERIGGMQGSIRDTVMIKAIKRKLEILKSEKTEKTGEEEAGK